MGSGRVFGRAGGVGPDSGELALAEVLALRSLFLNLQFRAARATADRGGDARADRAGRRDEMQRARERLEAVGDGPCEERTEDSGNQSRGGLTMAEWGRKEYCEGMAEPDAGVDVDGDFAVGAVLRGDADAGVRG